MTKKKKKNISGAALLMECLVAQGVTTIFGYPGGAVLHIYDALYHYQDRISHILTAHEQGAAHAADGYARSSGKVGVCLATSGPGATNLITGIATAYLDSVPMVAITGNVPMNLLGKDSFQEVDITGMTMAITKHNFIVKTAETLPEIIARAFQIASEGRPGPVLVDIPKNVTLERLNWSEQEIQNHIEKAKIDPCEIRPWRQQRQWTALESDALEPIVAAIKASKRPLIYAGGGVIRAGASEALLDFARHWDAPVATSLMGIGSIDNDDPLSLGIMGMHGAEETNWSVTQCDMLLAVGSRFSDRVLGKLEAFAEKAIIVHIDIDPAEIGKNITERPGRYYNIIRPLAEALNTLKQHIEPQFHRTWRSAIAKKRAMHKGQGEISQPQIILETLRGIAKDHCIIATDVGQHQMWTAQYFSFNRPRQFLTSGGLGTMGFGLGAAIGAQLANPKSQVVLVTGDGCFHMNCNELSTAVKYQLPIKIILFNNGVLGMVRQWQHLFCQDRFSQTTLQRGTHFEALAEAFGAKGYALGEGDNIQEVLSQMLSTPGPALLNCTISPDLLVMPMVPPGAGIGEMLVQRFNGG